MAVPVANLVDGNVLAPVNYSHPLLASGPALAWIPTYDRGFVDGPSYDTPCGVEDNDLQVLRPMLGVRMDIPQVLASFLPSYYREARAIAGRIWPRRTRH